jgi:hypothetical protein
MKKIRNSRLFITWLILFMGLTSFVFGSEETSEENINNRAAVKKSSHKSGKIMKAKKISDDENVEALTDKPKGLSHRERSLPKPAMPKKDQFDYDKITGVLDKFLSKGDVFGDDVQALVLKFEQNYKAKQKSELDLTGLSSRARIYLLQRVINTKVAKIGVKAYWVDTGKFYLSDQYPTTFKIEDFTYTLYGGATKNQKGSGSLLGLCSSNKGEKYDAVLKFLEGHKHLYPAIAQRLKDQKKNGNPIVKDAEITTTVLAKFLNGLNLLLDYEVARRLVEGDPYSDLPVLLSLEHLLTHFSSETLKIFLEGENGNSPFTGERKKFVQEKILPIQAKGGKIRTSSSVRKMLSFSHKDDEESGEVYSGEENDETESASVEDESLNEEISEEIQPKPKVKEMVKQKTAATAKEKATRKTVAKAKDKEEQVEAPKKTGSSKVAAKAGKAKKVVSGD